MLSNKLLNNQSTSAPAAPTSFLYIWGNDNDAGFISRTPKITPQSASKVAVGEDAIALIDNNNQLYVKGESFFEGVTPGVNSWTMVNVGGAIHSNGSLFAVGYNDGGALGVDGPAEYYDPGGDTFPSYNIATHVKVGHLSWQMISGVPYRKAAIRSDGLLFTWGDNNFNFFGNIGDGTLISRSSPVQIGTSSWSSVSVGASQMAAIRADGALFTWGYGGQGSLGDGNNFSNRSSPIQIGTSSWSTVSVGTNWMAAIRSDGALFTWGTNSNGPLGLNTGFSDAKSSPVQVGTSSWASVSAGTSSAMGITVDGALYGWGGNNFGQVGDLTTVGKSSPVQIAAGTSWSSVSTSGNHTAAIKSDGTLWTWGFGTSGQLGNGSGGSGYGGTSSPGQVGTSSWVAISTYSAQTYGKLIDGTIYGWGYPFPQLGEGGNHNGRSSPVQIGSTPAFNGNYILRNVINFNKVGTSSWSQVFAGPSAIAAIRSDGALFTWGVNTAGRLGVGDVTNRSSPTQVQAGTSWSSVGIGDSFMVGIQSDNKAYFWGSTDSASLFNYEAQNSLSWTSISAGLLSTAAIRSDGALFTWGLNQNGQLGTGNIVSRSAPVQIGTSSWSSVSVGGSWMAAIRSDGALFTWGYNFNGLLGDGTRIDKSSPVQIGTSSWSSVSAGSLNTLAIRLGGSLYAWGFNGNGQCGDSTIVDRSSPVQIGTSSWTSVSSGSTHAFAIRSDRGLFAWGSNTNGRLGLNITQAATGSRSSPVQIGTSSWTSVSAGEAHALAVRLDGGLFAWGSNANGRLGLNVSQVTGNRSSPVQVGTSSWTLVSAGASHTAAIRLDGGLFAWGSSTEGQTGLNIAVARSSPVQVGTSSWVSVSAGGSHTAALGSGQLLFAWGFNSINGQVGDETVVNKSSPVQVYSFAKSPSTPLLMSSTLSWSSISASRTNVAAIRSTGTLYTLGNNFDGQLGLGDTVSRSVFTAVGSSSWTSVSVGGQYMAAIRSGGSLFAWGVNTGGQIGDSTIIFKSSPVQIGSSSWTFVSAGKTLDDGFYGSTRTTLAVRYDGALFTWGFDGTQYGLLGNNTDGAFRSSPVQVGSKSWSFISAGNDTMAGITT